MANAQLCRVLEVSTHARSRPSVRRHDDRYAITVAGETLIEHRGKPTRDRRTGDPLTIIVPADDLRRLVTEGWVALTTGASRGLALMEHPLDPPTFPPADPTIDRTSASGTFVLTWADGAEYRVGLEHCWRGTARVAIYLDHEQLSALVDEAIAAQA
jgi:hypothetical protein